MCVKSTSENSVAPASRWGGCGLARAVDGTVAAHERPSSSSPSQGNCYPTGVWKNVFHGRAWEGFDRVLLSLGLVRNME